MLMNEYSFGVLKKRSTEKSGVGGWAADNNKNIEFNKG